MSKEKVILPFCVIDCLEWFRHEEVTFYEAMDEIENGRFPVVGQWLESKKNKNLFTKAWLGADYEEEGPLYYVILPSDVEEPYKIFLGRDSSGNILPIETTFDSCFIGGVPDKCKLSQEEIDRLSGDYWPFATQIEKKSDREAWYLDKLLKVRKKRWKRRFYDPREWRIMREQALAKTYPTKVKEETE